MQSKEKEIEKLNELPIYDLLRQRSELIKEIEWYEKQITPPIDTLIENSIENLLFLPCLRLMDGDTIKANKIYRTLDILKLHRLLTLKMAYEFRNDFKDLQERKKNLKEKHG